MKIVRDLDTLTFQFQNTILLLEQNSSYESTTLIVYLNLCSTFNQNIENILFNSSILWNKGLIEKLKG